MPGVKGTACAGRGEGVDVGDRGWGEERKTEMICVFRDVILDCKATKPKG